MNEKQNTRISKETGVFVISAGLMIVGTAGFFAFRNSLTGQLSAHAGALGLIGVFAWVTGLIARKRGFRYWTAFSIGLALPIVLGVGAVLLWVFAGRPLACGGVVSLSVAILTIVGYSSARTNR